MRTAKDVANRLLTNNENIRNIVVVPPENDDLNDTDINEDDTFDSGVREVAGEYEIEEATATST